MKVQLGIGFIDSSDLNVAGWLRGGIAAFVSGGAAAVSTGFAVAMKDPEHYGALTWNWFALVSWVFITSGLLGLMAFLAKQPLPDKLIEKTIETTEVKGKPMATITTVKETSVEPVKPAGDS